MVGEIRDTGNAAKVICAICYEDVKPVIEDLQSVSLCGHVFHELCLQQWLEYCPPNKKATCPVCKHQCSNKDIHRLYFQSVSESTQQTYSQRPRSPDFEDVEVLRANVKRLEGQLTVVTGALESHQQHIKEISEELSSCQHRAEKAEAARAKAIRDKVNSEDLLLRKQEELVKSTTERSKLWEKNIALAKELAAHKLVANLDLEEDQVLKIASVVHGSNKDDIIDTLRKSLVIRNKSYKELMEKCNQLGTGENQSLRKLEKAVERIKRLKARVQELERTLEEKENASLRYLAKTKITQAKDVDSAINKLNSMYSCHKDLESNKLFNDVGVGSHKSQGDISEIVPSTCKQATETLPDLQMEVGRGNTCSLRPKENFRKDKFHDTNQVVHGTNEEHPVVQHAHSYPVSSECVTGGDGIEVGFSTFLQSDASLPRNTNQFSTTCTKFGSVAPDDVENGYGAFVDSKRVDANKTTRIPDGVRNSTSGSEMAEQDMEKMGITDDNSFLPIKREAGRVHLTSSFINEQSVTGSSVLSKGVLSNGVNGVARKWCRQDHGQNPTSSGSGTLIAVGADGRGGRIKVLKNPRQPLDTGLSSLWSRQPKRSKTLGGKPIANSHRGLQIEHFFQKRQD